jgi:predicted nucleotidyltransferase
MPVEDVRTKLGDYFREHEPDVAVAYLFGSVAQAEDRPGSDVDVAVLYRSAPPLTLSGLGTAFQVQDRLEGFLGRRVDVVVLNTAAVDLARRVLRDGALLVDRDPTLRIRFEVRVRREYFDLEPVLRRYRRSVGAPG